ncbi:hypothetical protein [Streptomyces aurantiacus]|nr:hypothetical protein [Streptomyces aurantiacus]
MRRAAPYLQSPDGWFRTAAYAAISPSRTFQPAGFFSHSSAAKSY